MADFLSDHSLWEHKHPGYGNAEYAKPGESPHPDYRYEKFGSRGFSTSGFTDESVHQTHLHNDGRKNGRGRTDSGRKDPGKKRPANPASLIRKTLNVLIILLVTILVLELVFHFVIAPGLELKHVQLDSDMDITMQEVEQAGGFSTGDLFYRLDESGIQSRLEALPEVLEAEVKRIFPDSLGVKLRQREELAIVMLQGDQGYVPAAVDSQGVIFRTGREIRNWELPVIHGVELENSSPGAQLNTPQQRMLQDVQNIMKESPQLLRAFSELRMDEVYPGIYEWVLIPVHMQVRLRAAAGLDGDTALFMLKTLDMMKDRGLEEIDEIDFRTGDVIYSNERGEYGLE
ncbi:cell division protein FtsQ/DivIB [Salinispira pacifica]|uniref:Cell division protein FtsQ n=1 Tax=Salinispira pacifica TaxID=1307761 RepID=V5WFL2_9SPIO|nr:FtsQ-type POTRA domain-containing protein [Salinispira pacifica]AHC14563.1 Cell division protein FtsQ [Salinispira pacifica]